MGLRTGTFYRALQASTLGRLPFQRRVELTRGTLAWAAADKPLAVASRLGWLSAYGAAFAVGAFAVIQVSRHAHRAPTPLTRYEVARGSLSCASQGVSGDAPREVSRGNSPLALLYGAVMFDSPEALATRQAALAAALPETLVRPLGPVLLLWRPIVGASTPSKPFSVAEQRRLSAARMGALLRSAGERYVEGSVLSVECDAPGPSEAEAVRSTLATYADDSMKWAASGWDDPAWNAGGAPIPPWADDPSPNAANPAPHRLSIFPSRDLARVRIQLSLGVDSIESDVNPLLRWLCARSCVNTRVVLDAYR